MRESEFEQKRKFAALAYALGIARGGLTEIANEDLKENAQRIYDLTSSYRIAKCLGLPETAMDVDWDEYLTTDEKNKIAGYNLDT